LIRIGERRLHEALAVGGWHAAQHGKVLRAKVGKLLFKELHDVE
jgi:hypothetical protein